MKDKKGALFAGRIGLFQSLFVATGCAAIIVFTVIVAGARDPAPMPPPRGQATAPPTWDASSSPSDERGSSDEEEATDYLRQQYGLTEEEALERLADHSHLEELQEELVSDDSRVPPSVFGGIWYDNATGTLTFALTDLDYSDGAEEMIERHGLADNFEIVAVEESAEQLDDIVAELTQLLWTDEFRDARNTVIVGPAHLTNSVEITILTGDEADTSSAEAYASEAVQRYGDTIVVRRSDSAPAALFQCTPDPYCDPPLRAGLQQLRDDIPQEHCSTAFAAESRQDEKPYIFTAGHCLNLPSGTWIYTAFSDFSSHYIGPPHNSEAGPSGDAGILTVDNPVGWQFYASNRVVKYGVSGMFTSTIDSDGQVL